MEIEMPHKRDRGQVGIGTLIVFIAMVLVAAIAAGVLINTAGFLQSQSEETGESSSEQVTNRVEVVSAVGDDISSSAVGTVNITVKQAPGAANIDLSSTIVQWTDDSGAYDLTYLEDPTGSGDISNAGTSAFNVTAVQENDGDSSLNPPNPVLNDPADRAKMEFDLTTFRGSGLPEGGSAELQINTQSGGTSNVILNVPQTLSGTSAVNL
jgi:flagellin FlaB